MKHILFISFAAFGLAACQTTTDSTVASTSSAPSVSQLESALSGKTLVHADGVTFFVNPNGRLEGKEPDGRVISGTWQIVNEQWCRVIEQPEQFKGSACQDVDINGNMATFHRANGSSSTYAIQS